MVRTPAYAPLIISHGIEFRHQGRGYRVVQVGNDKYHVMSWDRERRRQCWCQVFVDLLTEDDFATSLRFWVVPYHLPSENIVRDIDTLRRALEVAAGLIERDA